MLRLTTFGGVLLRDDGEPHTGAASQRRRLALLVLVAAAWARPISRDKLVGVLWPDVDEERARHALRQALHALQHALGGDALFLGTSALQLNPAVISSDVQELEEAAEAGAHQRLVALYKGPFLDGFVVSDAPEFEHWADAQRAHFARLHTASLEALAAESSTRGDRAGAVTWWRRLAAEHPVSSRYALGLMRALSDAGDRTGALQFAAVHETVVRQQLGTEPDAAVADLAAQLRAGEEPDATSARGGARAAAALRADAVRERARDRRLAWLDRTLGARFDIDAQTSRHVVGAIVSYQAFDRTRRVPVEIHLLDAGVSTSADFDLLGAHLDRIASLDEPHVAPLYEHGVAEHVVYYVVSRPEGVSLRDRLARERQLPLGEALAVADDVAAALAHAHERGVRHGDLRPKYVVGGDAGCVVTGLGIAEALLSATAHDRTSTAIRVGSPAYQSPEQLTGASGVDARWDVYALGCMLYEMLAGEVPFASGNPTHLVSAKFTAPVPSVRERRDSVTPELDAVVRRCLAKSPSDRYRDGGELRAALAAVRPTAGA